MEEATPSVGELYTIKKQDFTAQICALARNNIPVISLHDILTNRVLPQFSVAITFDDGNFSDYEIAVPILKANNIPATFFWIADNKEDNILNSDMASAIVNEGFSIGSHGISHCDLTGKSSKDQMDELILSKRIIGEKLNVPVDFFAFPYGMFNSKTINMAETAGYKAVFSTDARWNKLESGRVLFHRWSIKRNITINDFEKRILNGNFTFLEFLQPKLKRVIKLIIGQSVTDKLNMLIHSGRF